MAVVVVICCLLSAYWTLVLWGWRKDRADRAAAAAAAANGTAVGAAGEGGKGPGAYRMSAMETLQHAQARAEPPSTSRSPAPPRPRPRPPIHFGKRPSALPSLSPPVALAC